MYIWWNATKKNEKEVNNKEKIETAKEKKGEKEK